MREYRTCSDAEHPIVLYEYQPGRGKDYPKAFLEGFRGYLQTDGFAGYISLTDVTHVGCWAHVRRKFNDALEVSGKGKKSPTSAQGVAYCTQLFKIEAQLKDLTPEERQIKHPPAKPVDFHMRAKPSVPRGHVKRVIRSASCVETVTCCL